MTQESQYKSVILKLSNLKVIAISSEIEWYSVQCTVRLVYSGFREMNAVHCIRYSTPVMQ